MNSCTKRILAVLLTAVMLISLLAGCGEKKDDTQKEDTKKEDTTPSTGGDTTGGKEEEPAVDPNHPNWLCKEKTTLKITTYDAVNNSFVSTEKDAFWEWLEEETNVHVEWEIIPFAGYQEIIQARLAAGTDLADIIMVENLDNGQDAGENGILLDLAPYWDTHFTNTKAYFEARNVDYKTLVTNGKGEIFTLNSTQEPSEGHVLLIYNTAWMKKLGLEIPRTLEDFEKVLYAMKKAGDLNGNGKDDEVILTSQDILRMNAILGNAFGLENYYYWNAFNVDKNGKVWHEDTSENMKALLTFENKLYEDGILDSEIASMTANKMSEKIAGDRVGVFIYYSAFAMSYGALCSAGQADPLGEHYTLGYPLASKWNDNKGYFVKWERAANQPTGINANSEKAELAMRWLDFMFGNEQANEYRTVGILGKHHTRDADGNALPIMPAEGEWCGGSSNRGQLTLPYNQTKDQLLITKTQYPWYLAQYAYLRENFEFRSPSVPMVNYYLEDEQEIIDTYKDSFTSYRNEMHAKFIAGEADIDKDWDAFVSNMEKLGLKEITAVHQAVYDRSK